MKLVVIELSKVWEDENEQVNENVTRIKNLLK
jgi:hypothetical protein